MGVAPDVGVPEDLAKFYFSQMVAGIVSQSLPCRTGPNYSSTNRIVGVRTRKRHSAPRSQTRKSTSCCEW